MKNLVFTLFLFAFAPITQSFAQSDWSATDDFGGNTPFNIYFSENNNEAYYYQNNMWDTIFSIDRNTKISSAIGIAKADYNRTVSVFNNTLYIASSLSNGEQRVRSLDILDKSIPHARDIIISVEGSIANINPFEKDGKTKLLVLGDFTSITTTVDSYEILHCAILDTETGIVSAPVNPLTVDWADVSGGVVMNNGDIVFNINHDVQTVVYVKSTNSLIEGYDYFPPGMLPINEWYGVTGILPDGRLVFRIWKPSGVYKYRVAVQDFENQTVNYYGEILSEYLKISIIKGSIYTVIDDFYQNNGDRVTGNYVTRLNLQTGLFEIIGSELLDKLSSSVIGDSVLYVYTMDESQKISIYQLNTETGIWEMAPVKKLELYPNPVNNGEALNFSESVDSYTLCDVQGKVVKQGTTKTKTIDIQNLPAGLYNITAIKGKENLIGRFAVR